MCTCTCSPKVVGEPRSDELSDRYVRYVRYVRRIVQPKPPAKLETIAHLGEFPHPSQDKRAMSAKIFINTRPLVRVPVANESLPESEETPFDPSMHVLHPDGRLALVIDLIGAVLVVADVILIPIFCFATRTISDHCAPRRPRRLRPSPLFCDSTSLPLSLSWLAARTVAALCIWRCASVHLAASRPSTLPPCIR
jgi:hypothetical protein